MLLVILWAPRVPLAFTGASVGTCGNLAEGFFPWQRPLLSAQKWETSKDTPCGLVLQSPHSGRATRGWLQPSTVSNHSEAG